MRPEAWARRQVLLHAAVHAWTEVQLYVEPDGQTTVIMAWKLAQLALSRPVKNSYLHLWLLACQEEAPKNFI